MATKDPTEEDLRERAFTNLDTQPLMRKFLGSSLNERLCCETDWLINPTLQSLTRNPSLKGHTHSLEKLLQSVATGEVENEELLRAIYSFGVDKLGLNYDSQITDKISEVGLWKWLKENGFREVTKPKEGKEGGTVDFTATKNRKKVMAEAKRLNAGSDWLITLARDILRALIVRYPALDWGTVTVSPSEKYNEAIRHDRMARAPWIAGMSSKDGCLLLDALFDDMKVESISKFLEAPEGEARECRVANGYLRITRKQTEKSHALIAWTSGLGQSVVTSYETLGRLFGKIGDALQQGIRYVEKNNIEGQHLIYVEALPGLLVEDIQLQDFEPAIEYILNKHLADLPFSYIVTLEPSRSNI